jgi:hydroxyacylglutathione hydrolase
MTTEIHTIPLGFDNCYIIREEGTIMIDSGAPKEAKEFSRALEMLKMDPGDIQLIIISHGHWDHIGSARDIKALTGAKIAMHQKEKDWLENALKPMPPGISLWGHLFGGIIKACLPLVNIPPTEVDVVLGDEDVSLRKYGIDGQILHTPGHSSGSLSVLLNTGDAFVGDMAMNKFPLRFTPGLPIFAEDLEALKSSWKILIERGAQTVYPAHGPPFPVQIIQKELAKILLKNETET